MSGVPRSSTLRLSGWGRYPDQECVVYRPEREAEIAAIVAGAPTSSLISRGMGRSYGDASLNEHQGVILHDRFDRFLDLDEQAAVVSCEAAVSFAEIIDALMPHGFFLPITPGTKHISVGGAIAADVHGKNHHRDGTVSGQIVDFRLLTGSGQIVTCSREENADLFWATLGGMGLTGAVLDARLRVRRVETSYVRQQVLRCADLDAALDRMLDEDHGFEYAVAWIDCLARGRSLGRSVLMRANPAVVDDLPSDARAQPLRVHTSLPLMVPFELPGIALNSFNMRVFNQGFWLAHPERELISNFQSYFYPLDQVQHWNRIYGRRGVLQYQLVLPLETCRDGLVQILQRVTQSNRASFLAVLKTTGPANQSPLSFPIEGASLALDFPNRGDDVFELLDDLDRIVLERGGRVYLAKDARLSPQNFREMYPDWELFREIKAKYDPNNRFQSSLGRRLQLVDPS